MNRRRVIVITIDTLRADHLSFYGYRRLTSPTIDQIASDSVAFRWAFSPTSYTVPAHYSLMTGKYPSFHSIQFYNGRLPWQKSLENTLAEILLKHGFATSAFISSSVLSLKHAPQMGKGFLEYDETMTFHESTREAELRRRAKETNESAIKWITKHRNQDFFCWIHYMDVHGPYEAPKPYCDRFVREIEGMNAKHLKMVANGELGGIPEYQILNPEVEGGKLVTYETNYYYYLARYDGGICYIDSAIRELVSFLDSIGLYQDLLLIIASDHGEALGENNVYFFHGMTVTLDQIHVPLIIKFPRASGLNSKIIQTQASLIDISPTILDFFGLPSLDFSEEEAVLKGLTDQLNDSRMGKEIVGGMVIHGVSLLPLIQGAGGATNQAKRIVFSETETQISAIESGVQYLLGRPKPENLQFQFFHPDAPASRFIVSFGSNDSKGCPDLAQRVEGASSNYIGISEKIRLAKASKLKLGSDGEVSQDQKPDSADARMLSHLKALGYI